MKSNEIFTHPQMAQVNVKPYPLFENLIWLNSKEAAQYLRLSPEALRLWVYRGIIKPYKLGRLSRFKREELDKLIESSNLKEARHGN